MTNPLVKTCSNCLHSEGNLVKKRLKVKCGKSGKKVSAAMAGCIIWTSLTQPLQGEPT